MPAGGKALCSRCGGLLYRHVSNSLDRALALNLAAGMLFVMANAFPFISLKLGGRVEENVLVSGALALYRLGMGELGLLVVHAAAHANLDPAVLWPRPGPLRPGPIPGPGAAKSGLLGCHTCTLLVPASHQACPRCATPLHRRKADSLARPWSGSSPW